MPLVSSLTSQELAVYTARQLNHLFPDPHPVADSDLSSAVVEALDRAWKCFEPNITRYYRRDGRAVFNHLHGDHYATYLYFLSNCLYRGGTISIAEKVFLLNKCLHGVDLFYAVAMPEVFMLVHPQGSILGNARYGEFSVFYQNVTVGATDAGIYPDVGSRAIFYSKCSLIGQCRVGDNVVLASNTFLIDVDVPENSTVVGSFPKHRILPNRSRIIETLFSC